MEIIETEERTIPEHQMISGKSFLYGKGMYDRKVVEWNPDESTNPHVLIIGTSGSGKTRLIKKIMEYLVRMNKKLHVLDFQGDMSVSKETLIEFTARCANPETSFSISPFEFDKDIKNGGPKEHCSILVEIFKKAINPRLGAKQEKVLKKVFLDFFRYFSVLDEDESTWDDKVLDMHDFKFYYDMLVDYIEERKDKNFIPILDRLREDGIKLKNAEEDKQGLYAKRIDKITEELLEVIDNYKTYLLSAGEEHTETFDNTKHKNISFSYYANKDIVKIVRDLAPYIHDMIDNPIFQGKKAINSSNQVIRYNLEGLTNAGKPKDAIFFSEIVMNRVFRSAKIGGEYHKRKDKRRGRKVSDYIIIDESKLVLPTGTERDNPFNIQNRLAAEARKYGLGVIWATQMSGSYTKDILANSDTKVVLRLSGEERSAVKKTFGIKNEELLKEADIFGVGLVSSAGKKFSSVLLPWIDKKAIGANKSTLQKPF